ncbi:DedA family protein [Candidatus Peregrinibacteria bacterium]|nr:DedA family protein [Candidatus Peregrinibacteria bacterium]
MLIESCGIPFPSEIIMPFAGFLVAIGKMNFIGAVLAGTFGNLAGSLLAYWIGIKGGRPLIEKYGKYVLISLHDLDIADRWFAKRGEAIVFFGRLLPVIRTYISFPAGIAKMNLKKFCIYTFLGALPWSILFTWLGIKMQNNWVLIHEKLESFNMAVLGLVIACVGLYVWRHLKKRQHH